MGGPKSSFEFLKAKSRQPGFSHPSIVAFGSPPGGMGFNTIVLAFSFLHDVAFANDICSGDSCPADAQQTVSSLQAFQLNAKIKGGKVMENVNDVGAEAFTDNGDVDWKYADDDDSIVID